MTSKAIRMDRGFLRVAGRDAEHFLQNLVTCSVADLAEGDLTFGALLTPQGKIITDFFVWKREDGFLLETAAAVLDDLVKRLTLFRLRAAVDLEPLPGLAVALDWGGDIQALQGGAAPDPRLAALGHRRILEIETGDDDLSSWHRHRIDCGMPEMGADFESTSCFPHDALMDQFSVGGVAFSKGCYVGQEVVSRMRHRGTARNRFVKVSGGAPLPDKGGTLLVNERQIGTLGSSIEHQGLALVRIDKVGAALEAGDTIVTEDGMMVELTLPDFATFGFAA